MQATFAGASPDQIIDLSSKGTANCYIVSQKGYYKFKVVKGNSSDPVGTSESRPAIAAILWESFGTSETPDYFALIKEVRYDGEYIKFQTADTFKEGNAVIAVMDVNSNILWSWHIWLTDQPKGQVYYNNAGTMMDRNLGATSATPSDVGVEEFGLFYQWGRKDPFLGFAPIYDESTESESESEQEYHYDSRPEAKSTITWPSAVSSNYSCGTIEYAIAHPTTFITENDNNYDWYYSYSGTDNTRWTTSEKDKSIYDPCPPGWRVPNGGEYGVWSKAKGLSVFDCDYDYTKSGLNLSGQFGSASAIWYPWSGRRDGENSCISCVGDCGWCWSASSDGYDAYMLSFSFEGYVNSVGSFSRAVGLSVRCIQE